MSIQSIVHVPISDTNEDQTTLVPTYTLEQESAKHEKYVADIKAAIANGVVRTHERRVEANEL